MPTDPPAGPPEGPEPISPANPRDVEPPPEVNDERTALARFVAGAEPVVGRMTSAVESAISAAGRRWSERPGARVRRVRRMAGSPLASLWDVHPEARQANPRELGVQALDVDQVAGTAVGGPNQRGGDFLPLRPFRSPNWQTRWQRVRGAMDRLAVLPPIDVVKYGEGYWVLDGHNRVAAALYGGQVGIDAAVTELVLPGQNPSERPGNLASALGESRALRSAGHGGRSSGTVTLDDPIGVPRPASSPSDEAPGEP
jgi:hypothetical protein